MIYHAIKTGRLKAERIEGLGYLIDEDDLSEWLKTKPRSGNPNWTHETAEK